MIRKIVSCLLMLTFAGPVFSAPIVVIPGEVASYMWFPSGASETGASEDATGIEPVGHIGMFPVYPLPAGWLECDGSVISHVDFPDLVKFLGGEGATIAQLPDFRGEFLRGWDNGRGLDSGRALLSTQDSQNLSHGHSLDAVQVDGTHAHAIVLDAIPNHTHRLTGSQFVNTVSDSNHLDRTGPSYVTNNPATTYDGEHYHEISNISVAGSHAHAISANSTGGAEARPKNVSVIFAIKASQP